MIYHTIEKRTEGLLIKYDLFEVPINVDKLVTTLKVGLEYPTLSDYVSGFFVMKEGRPFIACNKLHNKRRRRFTLAHELGHFILHSGNKTLFVDKTKSVMFRDSDSSSGEQMREREANAFAAALLMPEKLIKQEAENMFGNKIVDQLAKKFGVSTQAMSFRLSNLGYDFGMF